MKLFHTQYCITLVTIDRVPKMNLFILYGRGGVGESSEPRRQG